MTSAQAVEANCDDRARNQILTERTRDERVVVVFECRREYEPRRRNGELIHFSLQRDREHPVNRRKRAEQRHNKKQDAQKVRSLLHPFHLWLRNRM